MRIRPAMLAALAAFVQHSVAARADAGAFIFGEVITVRSCPRILVVAERNGFSIIQLVAGPQVQQRDVLDGELERIGAANAVDLSHDNAAIRVIVMDSLLSRTQFGAHLRRYCNQ